MKIKILIIFLFLLCIQEACRKGTKGSCADFEKPVNVKEIDSVFCFKILSDRLWKNTFDSVSYDSLVVAVGFKEEFAVYDKGFSLIGTAYARQPCPVFVFSGKLDSIQIFNHRNNKITDVTSLFSFSGNRINNNDSTFVSKLNYYSSEYMQFKMIDPPIKTDTFQFQIKLFDKRGIMLEKMTAPVIITP